MVSTVVVKISVFLYIFYPIQSNLASRARERRGTERKVGIADIDLPCCAHNAAVSA